MVNGLTCMLGIRVLSTKIFKILCDLMSILNLVFSTHGCTHGHAHGCTLYCLVPTTVVGTQALNLVGRGVGITDPSCLQLDPVHLPTNESEKHGLISTAVLYSST
jgi:hypothetical protein